MPDPEFTVSEIKGLIGKCPFTFIKKINNCFLCLCLYDLFLLFCCLFMYVHYKINDKW